MVAVVVAEDDEDDRALLLAHLRRFEREQGVDLRVTVHPDGSRLVAGADHPADLLLLDIEMPGVDGLAVAARVRERDTSVSIVFVTRAAGLAVRGYGVGATGFVVKPVPYEAVAREVARAVAAAERRGARPVVLASDRGHLRLEARDIVAFEGAGRRVVVHTLGGRHVIPGPLKAVEAACAGLGFARCHHGYVVNLDHVRAADHAACELVTRQVVPISRARRTAFLAALTDHLGS
ncbi:LytR/AlgR family response regulator transcription factor [Cellulomonas hominis]|uniref:LytR/AlgR family response regulator transcription factor n=1 Tax=Cellulomonas hominis TaxID=156981 RepID=UPI001444924D|nr:LytTR family DNA-binding domain-containing protein [Cellulomonas hominis]NKY11021.1 response regulator transcription factor [Cellulomonas hominis]